MPCPTVSSPELNQHRQMNTLSLWNVRRSADGVALIVRRYQRAKMKALLRMHKNVHSSYRRKKQAAATVECVPDDTHTHTRTPPKTKANEGRRGVALERVCGV